MVNSIPFEYKLYKEGMFNYLVLIVLVFSNVACINANSQSTKKEINLDYINETVENYKVDNYKTVSIKSSKNLIEVLKENGLWKFATNEIKPIVVSNFPKDFKKLIVKDKKRAFFHSMIPMILVASEEIKYERSRFIEISKKHKNIKDFKSENVSKMELSNKLFILQVTKKYKTTKKYELLKRIDTLPISLVLSQTAIESAWGTSRFSVQGNNLFGVWSFNGKGLIPKFRKKGLKHRVAVYPSLLDSVRDYMLKINTVRAYKKLRYLRTKSKNSIYLTKGLLHYSERKEAYIKDLQKMIKRNRLIKFDSLHLKSNKI